MEQIIYEVWVSYLNKDFFDEKKGCFLNRAAAELIKKEYEKSTRYKKVWVEETYIDE